MDRDFARGSGGGGDFLGEASPRVLAESGLTDEVFCREAPIFSGIFF